MGKSEECVNQRWLWALAMPPESHTERCMRKVFIRKVTGQASISRIKHSGEEVSMVY